MYGVPTVDFCKSVECFNGGSCFNQPGGFKCHCTKGYKGQYCAIERQSGNVRLILNNRKFDIICRELIIYKNLYIYK